MLLQRIMSYEAPRAGRIMLSKGKKQAQGFIPRRRNLSLPARKELQTAHIEQPKRNTILASTKCSDYEPIDYCSPLFP